MEIMEVVAMILDTNEEEVTIDEAEEILEVAGGLLLKAKTVEELDEMMWDNYLKIVEDNNLKIAIRVAEEDGEFEVGHE